MFSNRLSDIDTQQEVLVSPAQLNMRSAAALAAVLNRTKRRFNVGQAAMLSLSSVLSFKVYLTQTLRVSFTAC